MAHRQPQQSAPLILIVDDDDDTRLLLARLLDDRGYRTSASATGREGLTVFTKERPEVVLLDYQMPDLSGLEVLQRLGELESSVPVLIITGHGDESTAATLMKSGAFDYLTKPFEPARITGAVARAVAHRRKVLRQRERDEREAERRRVQAGERQTLREAVRRKTREAETKSRKLELVNQKLLQSNAALSQRNRDITRLELIYQQMFDMAGDGILKLDLDGKVLMANRAACAILGEEQLKGRCFPELFDPASRPAWELFTAGLAGGRVTRDETELNLAGPDGPRTLHLRAVPLREQDSVRGMEVLLSDISARIHQEKVVKKLEERAIVAGLSRHLSHVLLNSLTGAGGWLRKARKAVTSDERLSGYLDIIRGELGKMEEVVRGYQDYVNVMRLNASSLRHSNEFVREFIELLRSGGDADLERVLQPVRGILDWGEAQLIGDDATILMDPAFLRLGLAYLIRGAAVYALRAGRERAMVVLRSEVSGRSALISVTTPGVTVPPELVASMFSPWEHQMLQQTFEDWGITIANGIAERHQGALDIVSGPEETRYELRFPAVSGTDEPGRAPAG